MLLRLASALVIIRSTLPYIKLLPIPTCPLSTGSKNSSNSNRLKEIGIKAGVSTKLVDSENDLKVEWFNNKNNIGKITSGCFSPNLNKSIALGVVKGGKNNIGPALYNVVGRKVGVLDDYKYSKALAEYEKNWSFEELNGFLLKPKDWIKGTKMAYAGLRKEKDRASVILYLNKYSDSPLPLP